MVTSDVEVFAHRLEDKIRGDVRVLLPYYVSGDSARKVQGNVAVTKRGISHKGCKGAFQFTEVCLDAGCEVSEYLFIQSHAFTLRT